MKRYTFKVPVGENLILQVVGDYVRVESASVTLIIEEPAAGQVVYLEQGDDARLKRFVNLYLRHDDGAAQTVTISIGDGTQKSSARVGGSISTSKATRFNSVADASVAGSTVTLLLADDSPRREAIITSLDTNTENIRIGDSLVGAARGTPLAPGMSITINSTGAIYAFHSGAAAQNVAITAILD